MKLREINNRRVVEHEVLEELPYYQQKMIQNGEINEALPMVPCEINGVAFYHYQLEREQSICQMAAEKMSTKWMRKVIHSILICMEKRADYLLGNDQFMLQPEWLFWYQDDIRVIILPEDTADEKRGLCRLIEFFMEKMDTEDREQVLFVYGLYRLLKNTDNLYQGLKDFLQEPVDAKPIQPVPLSSAPEQEKVPRPAPSPILPREEVCEKPEGLVDKLTRLFGKKKTTQVPMVWENETVVLNPDRTVPTLVCVQSGEKIRMHTMPFLIGKNPERVDGVIEEPTVSRVHGKFYREQEQLYYMDQDSTNGTRINSMRAAAYESCIVHPGDQFFFGGAEYRLC